MAYNNFNNVKRDSFIQEEVFEKILGIKLKKVYSKIIEKVGQIA